MGGEFTYPKMGSPLVLTHGHLGEFVRPCPGAFCLEGIKQEATSKRGQVNRFSWTRRAPIQRRAFLYPWKRGFYTMPQMKIKCKRFVQRLGDVLGTKDGSLGSSREDNRMSKGVSKTKLKSHSFKQFNLNQTDSTCSSCWLFWWGPKSRWFKPWVEPNF